MLARERGSAEGRRTGGELIAEGQFAQGLDVADRPRVGPRHHGAQVRFDPVHGLAEAIEIVERGFREFLQRLFGLADGDREFGIADLHAMALGELRDRWPDEPTRTHARLADRLVVQLQRGEHRPPLLDPAVAADVPGLERLPACVLLRGDHVLQPLALRIAPRLEGTGKQGEIAEETAIGIDLDRRREQHFLRLRNRLLDRARVPLHPARQRRQRAEHPHHVITLADPPQAGTGLHAGDDDGLEVADRDLAPGFGRGRQRRSDGRRCRRLRGDGRCDPKREKQQQRQAGAWVHGDRAERTNRTHPAIDTHKQNARQAGRCGVLHESRIHGRRIWSG